jgi:hypothetical protein
MIVFICNMSVNKEILAGWANVKSGASDIYVHFSYCTIGTSDIERRIPTKRSYGTPTNPVRPFLPTKYAEGIMDNSKRQM